MTTRNPLRIAGIINFQMTSDGTKYAFVVQTTQGAAIDLEIEAEELGTIVQYLVSHAGAMGHQRFSDGFESDGLPKSLSPIPTKGFYTSTGTSHDTTLLVADLYTFDLAFEIPNTKLEELSDGIRRTAKIMSSDHKTRN